MGKVIPREQLVNLKTIKLAAFDPHTSTPGSKQAKATNAPVTPKPPPPPSREELEAELQLLREKAHAEGFAQGEEAGRQSGLAAGLAEAQAKREQLQSLLEEMDNTCLRQDATIASEVLELALTVARHIVRGVFEVHPEVLLGAIREAMLALPSLEMRYRLITHPSDTELVREWVEREHAHLNWEVMEDTQIERGGFRIESAHNELDATLSTRWQQVLEGLGADPTWLSSSE